MSTQRKSGPRRSAAIAVAVMMAAAVFAGLPATDFGKVYAVGETAVVATECEIGSRNELFLHRYCKGRQDFRRDRIGKGFVGRSLVQVFIRFKDRLCFIEVC